jgi:hypothetical protein
MVQGTLKIAEKYYLLVGIHGVIEIHPDLFHFDVRLVDAPRAVRGFEMGSATFLYLWYRVLHPTVNRGVIDVQGSLAHHLLQILIAERFTNLRNPAGKL